MKFILLIVLLAQFFLTNHQSVQNSKLYPDHKSLYFDSLACERLLFAELMCISASSNFRDIVRHLNSNMVGDGSGKILHNKTVSKTFEFTELREFNGTYLGKATIALSTTSIIFNIDFHELKVILIRIDTDHTELLQTGYLEFIDYHSDYIESMSPQTQFRLHCELVIPENFSFLKIKTTNFEVEEIEPHFLKRPIITNYESSSCSEILNNDSVSTDDFNLIVCNERNGFLIKVNCKEVGLMNYHYSFHTGEEYIYHEINWYTNIRQIGMSLKFTD